MQKGEILYSNIKTLLSPNHGVLNSKSILRLSHKSCQIKSEV